jgi:hypothetical protein
MNAVVGPGMGGLVEPGTQKVYTSFSVATCKASLANSASIAPGERANIWGLRGKQV